MYASCYLYTTFCIGNPCVFLMYATIVSATHVHLLKMSKNTSSKIQVVQVVMQLTPSVVTILSSTLSLQKHINRGREFHERGLELLHCHAGRIKNLFAHTFVLVIIPLCCRAWRLSSLEKRSSRTRSRFHEVPNLERRYNCTCFQY